MFRVLGPSLYRRRFEEKQREDLTELDAEDAADKLAFFKPPYFRIRVFENVSHTKPNFSNICWKLKVEGPITNFVICLILLFIHP